LAKIGEIVVWTNCGKLLKAAKIQGFRDLVSLFNLSFSGWMNALFFKIFFKKKGWCVFGIK